MPFLSSDVQRLPSWVRSLAELAADVLEALFEVAFYGGAEVPWWAKR